MERIYTHISMYANKQLTNTRTFKSAFQNHFMQIRIRDIEEFMQIREKNSEFMII